MAKATTKTYVVADKGYLLKDGKVYKTGEEISLTADEFKNVEEKVVSPTSDEGKALTQQNEERQEAGTQTTDTDSNENDK